MSILARYLSVKNAPPNLFCDATKRQPKGLVTLVPVPQIQRKTDYRTKGSRIKIKESTYYLSLDIEEEDLVKIEEFDINIMFLGETIHYKFFDSKHDQEPFAIKVNKAIFIRNFTPDNSEPITVELQEDTVLDIDGDHIPNLTERFEFPVIKYIIFKIDCEKFPVKVGKFSVTRPDFEKVSLHIEFVNRDIELDCELEDIPNVYVLEEISLNEKVIEPLQDDSYEEDDEEGEIVFE